METIKQFAIGLLTAAILAISVSLASGDTLYFRNELSTDITIQLKAAQHDLPTTLTVARGERAAFDLVSNGPFDVIVTPISSPNQRRPSANDIVFFKRAVDLRAIAREMNGNVVIVRGVFDFI